MRSVLYKDMNILDVSWLFLCVPFLLVDVCLLAMDDSIFFLLICNLGSGDRRKIKLSAKSWVRSEVHLLKQKGGEGGRRANNFYQNDRRFQPFSWWRTWAGLRLKFCPGDICRRVAESADGIWYAPFLIGNRGGGERIDRPFEKLAKFPMTLNVHNWQQHL